jgi:branched-chain amino acid transport system permease protein
MTDFTQTLVTSLAVGSLYSLIALGYTMVYGILKFINFAHSDVVVLGAWLSYVLAKHLLPHLGVDLADRDAAPPLWAAGLILILAMATCGAIGFLIERFAYRPLRRAPRLNVLITAIGVSLLLQNVGQLPFVFGASPARMPTLIQNVELWRISFGGAGDRVVVIGLIDVMILSTAAVLMLALEFLVFRTRMGIAMRAVSFSTDNAALMGVPVDRVISITFVLGAALAAAAGFLYALKYPGLNQPAHTIWVLVGLKAFVAAVIGGIGNLRGAVLGGFVIAAVEQFGAFYWSSNYRDVYVFTLLIVILLVRPTGLLGSTIREKV